jgi:hypothetical protein
LPVSPVWIRSARSSTRSASTPALPFRGASVFAPDIVHGPNPKRLIGGKPMADGPTINDRVMELRLNLNRLQAIVEEVALEIDDGKLDSAALLLGTLSGKIGGLTESYRGLQERLRDEGADPERAQNNA